jgi:hypothetical protein
LAASPVRPQYWYSSFLAAKTLWLQYGHLKSVRSRSAIDQSGEPLPWYTYPAIEFLQQLDFSQCTAFEYGAGNSTLFWAHRVARLVSVEDEEQWAETVRQRLPSNATLLYESDLRRYVDTIRQFSEGFDIIIVDGPARGGTRLKCARAGMEHLKPGGMIILDNSDWLPQSARALRESGLLQVDMSGFIPIGSHTQTTSFFFHRAIQLRPRGNRQPHPSMGAVLMNWEPTSRPSSGGSLEWGGERVSGVIRQERLEKETPDGVRVFEVAVCHRDSSEFRVLIYDCLAQRILLGAYGIPPTQEAIEAEILRLRSLSWEEFCAFARGHHLRRYVLA